ncbi:MAG: type III pantothenate kinase [Myxococcales bacterium]|nr:type III pantothenate kinase [Myxococcales bacterium]
MLLVLDVGNTNTVVGVFEGETLRFQWRLQSYRERTADEHGIALRQLFSISEISPADIEDAIVSCVVPPVIPRIEEMLARYFKIKPLLVGPGVRTGMKILYENPREVGADRVVNAVAAYERHKAGLIVVDFGTATTFDAVTPKGEYLGGAIAPGMAISADALFRRAAMLPRVDIAKPSRVIGRNTVMSMQSGLVFGYAGLVREMVRRFKEELTFETRVYATGGLAELISDESGSIDEVDQHLTLDGLRIIYNRNREVG